MPAHTHPRVALVEFAPDGAMDRVVLWESPEGSDPTLDIWREYLLTRCQREGVTCYDVQTVDPEIEVTAGAYLIDDHLVPVTTRYWANPRMERRGEIRISETPSPTGGPIERLRQLPAGFAVIQTLDDAWDIGTIYCSICQDSFPDDPRCGCRHVVWCHGCGSYSGIGADEGCCPHVHPLTECPDLPWRVGGATNTTTSPREADEEAHVHFDEGADLLPEPCSTCCLLCGHDTVLTGPEETLAYHEACGNTRIRACRWCGANPPDWAWLASLPALPATTAITLHCIWSARGDDATGCSGQMIFHPRHFAQSIGAAGHGPFSYLLANRFALHRSCPVCHRDQREDALLRHNRATLLALVVASQQ